MAFADVLELEYINVLLVLESGSECKYFTLWKTRKKLARRERFT